MPHKDWWTARPDRERRLRTMLERDLGAIGGATMLLLVAILVGTTVAARAQEPALPTWVLGLLALYVAGMLSWVVLAVTRRYRPDS